MASFIASRFVTGIASSLLRAAILWHVYDLSGSALQLGLLGLVQFVPALAFSLIGGAFADTYDRRRIVMLSQVFPLTCAAGLAATTLAGSVGVPLIFAAAFVIAVARAFESPAAGALLPTLLPMERFPAAVAVNSSARMLAFATGPMLQGLAIAAWGVASAYLIYLALAVGGLLALVFVRPRPHGAAESMVNARAIREGLAFVFRNQVVLGCMTLDMFAVIFGGATALLPIYAEDILGVGAVGYGLLTSSLELGALLMSIPFLLRPPARRAGRALLLAVLAYGVATIVFGLSRSFPLSIAAYMAVGMADFVSVVMRQIAIQLSTPDELRGRVSAVNMIFIGASNQLGAAESGLVAAATSPTFSVVSGAIGSLAVLLLVAIKLPGLRNYRTDAAPDTGT